MSFLKKTHSLKIYEVNNCLIDIGLQEITHGLDVVHPEKEVFDTLVYLIENRDHTVDLDEFRQHLWCDNEVSEFEIVSNIAKARQAILDDHHNPVIIYDTQKPGYRMNGEVLELEIN